MRSLAYFVSDMAEVKENIETAIEIVRSNLKPVQTISEIEARAIIGRYVAAVEGNFVPWMSAATLYCRSPQGKFAAMENLDVEIRGNHPGMLRSFAKSSNSEPTLKDYNDVQEGVDLMRIFVSKANGLEILTIMATLENVSSVFVPFLEKLAVKLGSEDFTYLSVHGEADIHHANQFIWAIDHEVKFYSDPLNLIRNSISMTLAYLDPIFNK